MNSAEIFDRPENRVLLVVCARKQIRRIGIAGLIWGILNIAIGAFAIQVNPINAGILLLGLLMLGSGIGALYRPSLNSILLGAFVSLGLFGWNLFISIWNTLDGEPFHSGGLVMPLVIAGVFAGIYKKLRHLGDMIPIMPAEDVKRAKMICNELQKKKVKNEPNIAETADKKFRYALTGDRVFCFRKDLLRAFYVSKEEFRAMIGDLSRKKLRFVVEHPLGKLKQSFNKATSEKIRGWLSGEAGQEAMTIGNGASVSG